MDGESAESDVAAVDVEPQPRAAKRGRRSQDDGASPPTVRNGGGGGDAPGRVLRPRGAGPVGGSRANRVVDQSSRMLVKEVQ